TNPLKYLVQKIYGIAEECYCGRRGGNSQFSTVQVPGNIDHDDILISLHQQSELQQVCSLIVQQVFIPVLHYQLRHKNGNLPVGTLYLLCQNMINKWLDEESIWRFDRRYPRLGQTGIANRR